MHNRVYWHIPYRTSHPQETMSPSTGSSPPCSLLGINFYDSPPFEYGRHSLAWVHPGHKSLASSHHMACCFSGGIAICCVDKYIFPSLSIPSGVHDDAMKGVVDSTCPPPHITRAISEQQRQCQRLYRQSGRS